jgi:serpin B
MNLFEVIIMKSFIFIITICVIALFGGIGMAGNHNGEQDIPNELQIAEDNNEFAVDLYQQLRVGDGNLFFSPFSISTALAMAYAGAMGETADEMKTVLRVTKEGEVLHGTFGNLISSLNKRGEEGAYQMSVANALWGQSGIKLLEKYLGLTQSSYGAGLKKVDFISDPEAARQTINAWVEEKTREKIKELLKRGVINDQTRLVLTNAIYFKGSWEYEFDEDRTRDEPFTLISGEGIEASLMRQQDRFEYMECEDFQVLCMPYVKHELSMIIILPREMDGITKIEKSLSADDLADCMDALVRQQVEIYVPKFKMTSEFNLSKPLKAMGMKRAFSAELADFSGITGARDFFIWAVVHKAFVEVNEEGTEAAAATGLVFGVTAVKPDEETIPVFRADHPFLFLIRDNESGSILFMGRVMNPTE